jgi:hypothetical protein
MSRLFFINHLSWESLFPMIFLPTENAANRLPRTTGLAKFQRRFLVDEFKQLPHRYLLTVRNAKPLDYFRVPFPDSLLIADRIFTTAILIIGTGLADMIRPLCDADHQIVSLCQLFDSIYGAGKFFTAEQL